MARMNGTAEGPAPRPARAAWKTGDASQPNDSGGAAPPRTEHPGPDRTRQGPCPECGRPPPGGPPGPPAPRGHLRRQPRRAQAPQEPRPPRAGGPAPADDHRDRAQGRPGRGWRAGLTPDRGHRRRRAAPARAAWKTGDASQPNDSGGPAPPRTEHPGPDRTRQGPPGGPPGPPAPRDHLRRQPRRAQAPQEPGPPRAGGPAPADDHRDRAQGRPGRGWRAGLTPAAAWGGSAGTARIGPRTGRGPLA